MMSTIEAPATSTENSPKRWIALGMLALGLAMIILDGTIVGVALPVIVADLHLDLTDAQWVNSLYSVVFAALLLTFGRTADRLGRRRLFIIGVIIFCAGSLTAATAATGGALIASRALQGVGGAMVLPSTLSTVNATFHGRDRALAFGVWGAVMAGVAAIGPLLGGWITTHFTWPLIFWVNLPIGVLVVIGALLTVTETTGDTSSGLDIPGLLLSAAGLGLIVFGLIEATTLGWWKPKSDLSLFGLTWPGDAFVSAVPPSLAVGALLVLAFVAWERPRAASGRSFILDTQLFTVPTFAWGNLAAMMVAVGEFALVFVLPLYLVGVLHLTTLGAGYVLAAMALGAFVAGASARHLSARFGAPRVVVLGVALEVVGAALTAAVIKPTASARTIAATLAVYGVGLGLAAAQLTSAILADVPRVRSGTASATQSSVRQLGAALGSAVAGSVLATRIGDSLRGVPPATFAEGTAVAIWVATGFLLLGLVGALFVAKNSASQA